MLLAYCIFLTIHLFMHLFLHFSILLTKFYNCRVKQRNCRAKCKLPCNGRTKLSEEAASQNKLKPLFPRMAKCSGLNPVSLCVSTPHSCLLGRKPKLGQAQSRKPKFRPCGGYPKVGNPRFGNLIQIKNQFQLKS